MLLYNNKLQGALVTWLEAGVVLARQITKATQPLCSPPCTSQQTCAVQDTCVSNRGGTFFLATGDEGGGGGVGSLCSSACAIFRCMNNLNNVGRARGRSSSAFVGICAKMFCFSSLWYVQKKFTAFFSSNGVQMTKS